MSNNSNAFMASAKKSKRQQASIQHAQPEVDELGKVAEWLWGRKNDDGTNYWVGRRAVLYKHNDPPKEGDMSSAGYRCCVFAEALDK